MPIPRPADATSIWIRTQIPEDVHHVLLVGAVQRRMRLADYIAHVISESVRTTQPQPEAR